MQIYKTSQQSFGAYLLKLPSEVGERRLNIFEKKFGIQAKRIFNVHTRNYLFEDEAVIGNVKKYLSKNSLPSRSIEDECYVTPWLFKTFAKEPVVLERNPAKEHPILFKLCPALFT